MQRSDIVLQFHCSLVLHFVSEYSLTLQQRKTNSYRTTYNPTYLQHHVHHTVGTSYTRSSGTGSGALSSPPPRFWSTLFNYSSNNAKETSTCTSLSFYSALRRAYLFLYMYTMETSTAGVATAKNIQLRRNLEGAANLPSSRGTMS